MSDHFELGTACLDPGITLIEASAGTGKTYAIAGMVVRLVAERGIALGRILIVTFTEAATRELRERVRSRIRDAIEMLETENGRKDEALAAFEATDAREVARAARRLKEALLSFDEASIFTIHGFCQRMLRENAFETGSLFDVELLTDAEPLWRETAEDFWRHQFYETDPEIGAIVRALGEAGQLAIDDFIDLLRKLSRHPELRILAEEEAFGFDDCQVRLSGVLGVLREEWRKGRGEIGELLRNTKALSTSKKDGYPPSAIEKLLEELSALEEDTPLPPAAFTSLQSLSARRLEAKTVYKRSAPAHPFFDLCAEFEELLESFLRLVRREFMQHIDERLGQAKKRRNVVTFDDLLTRLYASLKGPGGTELTAAIGGQFEVALIDEFQDTDPVQWEIFDRVFGGGRHTLFLIGDPKQAIYSFRGADIFTYMAARAKASRRFTLGKNWRSDKALIEGANRLFSQHPEAFLFPEISFYKVEAAEKEVELDLSGTGLGEAPLRLLCVSDEEGGPIGVPVAKERILQMMLREMHRLLTCGATWNGRPLEPGDIAVLTRTNREADFVREGLVRAGIPAVMQTEKSVLQTDEAEHVLRLLSAILEPHKNGLVKGALSSPLFGYTADGLDRVDRDEGKWEELVASFQEWQESWNRHGFMRMFRSFLGGNGVKGRLLESRNGERMVTNYQHISECLHAAEYERSLTPSTLLRWLREQNERAEGDSDSYVVRLEKDEKAVQIVTIHRSKGLEYPVVFCPFNWSGVAVKTKGKDIIFHNEKDGNFLTWDPRPSIPEEHVAAFKREQMAEAVRLLYVAVTRARNRCYLFWAVTKESGSAESCALAHVFGCGQDSGPAGPAAAFDLIDGAGVEIEPVGDGEADRAYRLITVAASSLVPRTFTRDLPQAPLVTSFSGLTAKAHDEAPDRDIFPKRTEERGGLLESWADGGPSIFNFPKGAKAGNFFHSILEDLDFTRPETLPDHVANYLRLFRFDPVYEPVITSALRDLLGLTLRGGVKLGEIGMEDRLTETAFYFPIQPVTPSQLAGVFARQGLPDSFSQGLGRLSYSPVDGYMTGFIDLAVRWNGRYYVIDWKSNWLGASAADYGEEALREAMAGSYYYLQYHLYTLALHRHLAASMADYDYDRDFGGVFYLFLRGIDRAHPSSGVFYDRPSRGLVEKLEAKLMPPRAVFDGEGRVTV